MEEVVTPDRARTEYQRRRAQRPMARPDRFALWAVVLAVVAMFAGVATADAGSGGVSPDGDKASSGGTKGEARYAQIWNDRFGRKSRRWARRTSRCESGHDAKAYNPAGPYYGAFQFLKSTWRTAPRSPGLKPTRFRWKTQAVVAVLHKRKAQRKGWSNPWPVCG